MRQTLTEKTRQDLLTKSRSADIVKSYGTTRYERKDHQRVINSTSALNRIDMNAVFKANLLSFKIPIQGETNIYEVEVLFEGICDSIKREIANNHNKLEYKCVYRAIIDAINNNDIFVACTCDDFKFRHAYQASKGRYNAGRPQIVPAKVTNPNDTKGGGCKHIMKVIADLDWALNLATVINNYITYIDKNMHNKFENIIFPALYDISYDAAIRKGIISNSEDELANTMDSDDTSEIDAANSIDDSSASKDSDEDDYNEEEPDGN